MLAGLAEGAAPILRAELASSGPVVADGSGSAPEKPGLKVTRSLRSTPKEPTAEMDNNTKTSPKARARPPRRLLRLRKSQMKRTERQRREGEEPTRPSRIPLNCSEFRSLIGTVKSCPLCCNINCPSSPPILQPRRRSRPAQRIGCCQRDRQEEQEGEKRQKHERAVEPERERSQSAQGVDRPHQDSVKRDIITFVGPQSTPPQTSLQGTEALQNVANHFSSIATASRLPTEPDHPFTTS